MIAWAVAWNAVLGAGLLLDRASAHAEREYFGTAFTVAAIGTSALCFLVVYAPRFQSAALRVGASVANVRRDLMLLAAIAGFLGAVGVANLLSRALQA